MWVESSQGPVLRIVDVDAKLLGALRVSHGLKGRERANLVNLGKGQVYRWVIHKPQSRDMI